MGLGSFLKKAVNVGTFGLVGGSTFDNITGKSGERAATDAARIQAEQFNKLLQLYTPTIQAGQRQIPALESGATVSGLSSNIGDILGSDSFGALREQRMRSANQQLAQAGLRRSGAAASSAADIDADLAFQIESELNRRRQSIFGAGQTGIGGAGTALQGIGSSLAGGILGAQQASAQGTNNLLGIGSTLLSALALSDRRMKTNVIKVGNVGKANVYKWDWSELANSCGLLGESIGFMADEIKKILPECVTNVGGIDMVDYDRTLMELKHAN